MGKKMQHGLEFTIEDINDVLAFTSIEETMACSLDLRTKTQIHPFTYYNDIFWLLETDRRPDVMFNKKNLPVTLKTKHDATTSLWSRKWNYHEMNSIHKRPIALQLNANQNISK